MTDLESDTFLPTQYFTQNTEFNLNLLQDNRIYQILVNAIIGNECSPYSNSLNVDMFVYTEEQLNYTFNKNSLFDFVVSDDMFSTILFIEVNKEKVPKANYYTEYDRLFIDSDYLLTYENEVTFTLYTTSGVIDLNIRYLETLVPYMLSNNTVYFTGQDLLLTFELCGGQFIEINGSDIDNTDYVLTNNFLIIDSNFIQNLFDVSPERDVVILSYQLKNNDQVVIGYVFIHRTIVD